jgi:UDP:flavonoid glycosyltransferase YjiC (YdhE family)
VRFLFTLQPATGHLNPLTPVAHRLQSGGNEVLLATAPSFLGEIEAAGLQGVGVGRDWLESDAASSMPGFLEERLPGAMRVFAELAQPFLDDLLAQDWRPDLVVRETGEFAGAVYAEKLAVPCVVHGIGLRPPPGVLGFSAGEPLGALLDRAGLDCGLELFEGGTYLTHLPRSWVPEGPEGIEGEHFFQPARMEINGGPELPPWLAERDQRRPLVYATLGTVFNAAQQVFERLIEAAEGQDFDLLLAIGRNADPAAFEAPGNVHIESYVAQDQLLPRMAAVVCHGGMGTVMGALRDGLPVCCVPLGADQPINAMRCEELGCGRTYTTFTPEEFPIPHARPEDIEVEPLRGHINALLDDPQYRTAAARLADEIRSLPGVEEEVNLLVDLAHGTATPSRDA